MFGGLDDPTVFRVGDPTLGVPLLEVVYRDWRESYTPPPPPDPLSVLADRVSALEVAVRLLQRPWYVRLAAWAQSWWRP